MKRLSEKEFEDLVGIASCHRAFMSEEYEKAHGYLFSTRDAEEK